MSGIDDELREHFQALRELELARVPSFAEIARRTESDGVAGKRHVPWMFVGGVGALAAAAMLTVVVQWRREAEFLAATAAITRWQPPTDALLGISIRGPLDDGSAVLGASVLDSLIPASRED